MSSPLDSLLRHPVIWRGWQRGTVPRPALPTGFGVLDEAIPDGGWPADALTEVLCARQGTGEVSLLLPALSRLTREGRWVAWVAPPYLPYAPALAAAGVDLGRMLLVRAGSAGDALWAVEQALRSGVCGAVLAWTGEGGGEGSVSVSIRGGTRGVVGLPLERGSVPFPVLRRLQLAAQSGRAWGVLFRPVTCARLSSPAALRLLLERAGPGLSVRVLKCRGRVPSASLRLESVSPLEGGRRPHRPAGTSPRAVE